MRRGRVALGLALIAAVGCAYSLYHRQERWDRCETCGSGRWEVRHGVGLPSRPWFVVRTESGATDSVAYAALCGSGHEHAWKMELARRGTPIFAAHGHGRVHRNRFLLDYEHDPAFRDLVESRIRSGALTRAQAAALCAVPPPTRAPGSCPAHPRAPAAPDPLSDVSREPSAPAGDPEQEKLRRLGTKIFRAFHGTDEEDWYW